MDILIEKVQAIINTLGEVEVKGRANIEKLYGSMLLLDKILESLRKVAEMSKEQKGE